MSPDEEQAAWDLTDNERLVRNPAAYVTMGTEVQLRASIARPLRSIVEEYQESTRDVRG